MNVDVYSNTRELLILIFYQGKTNFEAKRNYNANTTLVALFEIRFRSLTSKKMQCSEVTAIP